MCSMTDVCVPAVPAVRITRGLVTERFIRRTVFTTGPTCHRMPAIRNPNNSTPTPTSVPMITATTRIERN
jgi:hypothetical protein